MYPLRWVLKNEIILIKIILVLRSWFIFFPHKSWFGRAGIPQSGQWQYLITENGSGVSLEPTILPRHPCLRACRAIIIFFFHCGVECVWIIVADFILLRSSHAENYYLVLLIGLFRFYQVILRHLWAMVLIKLIALCMCLVPWTLQSAFTFIISLYCQLNCEVSKQRDYYHLFLDEEFESFDASQWVSDNLRAGGFRVINWLC